MNTYPDPDRYPVGSPEREAEQQRKNELHSRAVSRLDDAALMQALHDPENQPSQWGTVPVAMAEASRRERIARDAMKAIVIAEGARSIYLDPLTVVWHAACMADAMIAELDKVGEPFPVGSRVYWCNEFGAKFPGVVARVLKGGRYSVDLDDGTTASVAYRTELMDREKGG